MAEWDPDDPSAVALGLLHRSIILIEELLEGGIVDQDFREEFVTYWGYKAHSQGKSLFSLIAPGPVSRRVRIWRGKGLEVVGGDEESLAAWEIGRAACRERVCEYVEISGVAVD